MDSRRISFIVLHSLLALGILIPITLIIARQIIPSLFTSAPIEITSVSYFALPAFIHILISFLGMLPALLLPQTSRNSIERFLLPPIYMTITLLNIPVVVMYLFFKGASVIGFSVWGRVYLFALLFGAILLLFIGLFHFGINTGKLLQFTLIAAAGCMLLAILVPLSVALHPLDPIAWVMDKRFYGLPILLGILSIFNFVALLLRERTQHNLFRNMSLMLILVGNFLYLARFAIIVSWIGVAFFALGVLISVPRGRFSQIQ